MPFKILVVEDQLLIDGPTGPAIGRRLAETGKTVVFMTANPEALDDDIPGALGVISKPLFDLELIGSIQYAAAVHAGQDALAPERMRRFSREAP